MRIFRTLLTLTLTVLALWATADAAALTDGEHLMDQIRIKVRNKMLIDQAKAIKLIANVDSRHAAQFALLSHLSQEEVEFLFNQGIFDVFVDFVVETVGTATTWVETQADSVADAFNSKVIGPVSGWTASALDTTKTWATGAYGTTAQGFTNFCNDVEKTYNQVSTQIETQFEKMEGELSLVQNYITSGGLENDLKRVAKMIDGAIKKVCDFPGAQAVMRAAIAAALKAAVCAATKLRAPGCKINIPIPELIKRALLGQIIKCASFLVLEECTGLCSGINDFIADTLSQVMTGTAYDVAANAVVGCMCGGCPGTCAFNNRLVCSGKWWITSATEFAAMVSPTPSGPSPSPTPGSINVFGDVNIQSVWYGQSIGNGGMDVTAHFCKQVSQLTDKINQKITINNQVLNGDPTPNIAKAFFVRYRLLSRGQQEFLFYAGPSAAEGYSVALNDLILNANRPYPGTFAGMPSVRVLRAYWTGAIEGPAWTTDQSTWPADTRNFYQGNDVTAYFWNALKATGDVSVLLHVNTFGEPRYNFVKTMILLYQMDEGQGFDGNTRLGIVKIREGTTVTAAMFPKLKGPLEVISAIYGKQDQYTVGQKVANVVSIVSRAFALSDTLLVNNDKMGGDPSPGELKWLVITYKKASGGSTFKYIVRFPAGENVVVAVSDLMQGGAPQ